MRVEHRLRAIWLGLATLLIASAAAGWLVPPQPRHAAAVAICPACHDGWFIAE